MPGISSSLNKRRKSALSLVIASATKHGCLTEKVNSFSRVHRSSLNEAHLISATAISLNCIFLHLLGVGGHVNSFIASDILVGSLV